MFRNSNSTVQRQICKEKNGSTIWLPNLHCVLTLTYMPKLTLLSDFLITAAAAATGVEGKAFLSGIPAQGRILNFSYLCVNFLWTVVLSGIIVQGGSCDWSVIKYYHSYANDTSIFWVIQFLFLFKGSHRHILPKHICAKKLSTPLSLVQGPQWQSSSLHWRYDISLMAITPRMGAVVLY